MNNRIIPRNLGTHSLIRVTIFALLLISMTVKAEELRLDSSGGSFEKVPVMDQFFGTCYAATIAQIIDAVRLQDGQDLKFRTSHIGIGLLYSAEYEKAESLEEKDFTLSSGYQESALTLASRSECLSPTNVFENIYTEVSLIQNLDFIRKKILEIKQDGGQEIAPYLGKKSLEGEELERFRAMSPNELLARANQKIVEQAGVCIKSPYYLYGTRVSFEDVSYIASDEEGYREMSLEDREYSGISLLSIVKDHLTDLQSLPLFISYCSNVLDGTISCGRHASLIIGYREINSEPEILIRNSWGKSCHQYRKELDCEYGNIWVPESELAFAELKIYKIEK